MDAVLAILRRKFYWLGPGGRYILSRNGRTLRIRAVTTGWIESPLKPYLRLIKRRFAELGFCIEWEIVLADEFEAIIDRARKKAEERKTPFDRQAFIRKMQTRERRDRRARGELFDDI